MLTIWARFTGAGRTLKHEARCVSKAERRAVRDWIFVNPCQKREIKDESGLAFEF